MAKIAKIKSNRIAAVVATLALFWTALFWYMWNHDYKIQRLGEGVGMPIVQKVTLRGAVRIDLSDESGPTADMTLYNEAPSKILALDTAALAPLYDIKLQVIPPGGAMGLIVPPKGMNAMATARHTMNENAKLFDKKRDSIVELQPGSGLTRHLPLTALFDFKQEGKYTLQVVYQPEAVAKSIDLLEMDAYEQMVVAAVSFDWPVKAPGVSSAPSSSPNSPLQEKSDKGH